MQRSQKAFVRWIFDVRKDYKMTIDEYSFFNSNVSSLWVIYVFVGIRFHPKLLPRDYNMYLIAGLSTGKVDWGVSMWCYIWMNNRSWQQSLFYCGYNCLFVFWLEKKIVRSIILLGVLSSYQQFLNVQYLSSGRTAD